MSRFILVIEDDPLLGEFLDSVLEEQGYTAFVVSDRLQALQIIGAIPPAVIVQDDCRMNDDLFYSTRLHQTPIITLSTLDQSLPIHVSYSERKPFDLDHLLSAIANVVLPATATYPAA